MNEKVKIGIIGCGYISGIYFTNLTQKFKNTQIIACTDLDMERARGAAKKYNISNVLSLEEIFDNKEIQIIVNLTIPDAHFEICKKALLSGKHTYVEKPLSITCEQGIELVALAQEKKLMLGCAPDTFLGAGIQTCRRILDSGIVGEPVAATAFFAHHGPERFHPDPEFLYKTGAGPLFDMGPYYLTTLVSLLGPAKVVSGMSSTTFKERTITSEKKYGQKISVETATHISGTIKFVDNVIVNITTSFDIWAHRLPFIEIYCKNGTIGVPNPDRYYGPVYIQTPYEESFKEIPLINCYSENSTGLGVADMANCIYTGRKNRANGEMANHVLEIMNALFESSETHTYVELKTNCQRPEPLPMGIVKGFVE